MQELLKELSGTEFIQDQALRKQLAQTFDGFCLTYLPHYFSLPPSDFAGDLMDALDDDSIRKLEIVGFRGSAKSTFASTAYIIYAALVKPKQYPFIISLTATGTSATAAMSAIKHELESNELLNMDFGKMQYRKMDDIAPQPRLESKEEWQARNILLPGGVRILARSRGQRIRGLRHYEHRPSLVVGDDIEDLEAIATQEKRDKTDKWWHGEVLPAMEEKGSRVVLIGNWLHMNGLMARAKDSELYHVLEFPLIRDGDGPRADRCTWKAKYPDEAAIAAKERELGVNAFAREMLLHIVPDEGQDVVPEDIHYYDEPPFDDGNYLGHGVDPAISTKDSADPTGIVTGEVTWSSGQLEIFIQPHPVNRRMSFTDSMDTMERMRRDIQHAKLRPWKEGDFMRTGEYKKDGFVWTDYTMAHEFFVEAVAFQQVMIEEMERRAYSVQGVHPIKDKRARLRVAARYIKLGIVKFPRHGCEELIQQLLGFGVEKHDDLVDALVYLILGVAGDNLEEPVVHYI